MVARSLRVLMGLCVLYFASWTLIYAWFMEGDFSYFWTYLKLVWSGSAGERPGLVQLYSLLLTGAVGLLGALVLLFRSLWRRRSSGGPNERLF